MFGRLSRNVVVLNARTFAAKAEKEVVYKAPIQLFGVHGRYATALYISATRNNVLAKVDNEVNAFSDIISKNESFSNYLSNPTVSRTEKTTKLNALLDEKTFSTVTRHFFLTLAANGKLGYTDKILGNFGELMRATKGQVIATIVSAEALNKKTLGTVQSAVLAIVGKGAQVDFKTRVNEGIMGGLQVQIGDKFLDLSLASRLNQVSAELDSISV